MIGWILSHKLVIVLIAATAAFGISTIVLAVQKSDLDECNDAVPTQPPGTSTTSGGGSSSPETSSTPDGSSTTEAPPEDLSGYRLPTHIVPSKYNLLLHPNLEQETFTGTVEITVNVKQESTEIRLHSKGLTILRTQINGLPAQVVLDDKFELLIVSLSSGDSIPVGEAVISIGYSGIMKDRIVGFYSSKYKAANGEDRTIATSKFEPTYARQAYPCFDEPNMKVSFKVSIVRPNIPTYKALSNMPSEKTTTLPEMNAVLVEFQESVKMSTYLSCFIVCDFESIPGQIIAPGKEEIPLQVYATPAQVSKARFARDVAVGVMVYFLGYFDIGYPLPKLDLIAIPDFVSGAMEHWGLVTFRETALLYDETMSSTANKQRVATVIAHELAHSWFGNLVTMDWWNDLWLNEGFASYIQFKGVDAMFPEWQMVDQFLIEELHPVLSLDATTASHPIVQTVLTPDQITAIFDTITYNKGASILRMLEGAVGEAIFKQCVKNYLLAHEYGNAVTQDFLDQLQLLVPESLDVTEFMRTWTVQKGYPIVTVVEEGDSYVLVQKRFLKDPDSVESEESPYGYTWDVPITYITNSNAQESEVAWFKYSERLHTIPKPAGINWIKFNPKQVGYYRVNYNTAQPHLWQNLVDNIADMPTSDQTHLLDDAFSIAESGQLSYRIPLDLTKFLKSEFNFIPWSVAASKLGQLKTYMVGSLEYSNYMKYVADLVTPAYDELSWSEGAQDGHLDRRARITVISLACSMGHSGCLQEAQSRFRAWVNNPVPQLSQDLRTIIYNYGMAASGETEWNVVFERFKVEVDANEKLNLMRSLASVKDTWLLRRLVELGWDDTIVRSQDYFTLLQYIAANPAGTSLVWDYVRENWQKLVDRFTLNERYLGRLIPAITGSFASKIKVNEMSSFFEATEAGAGEGARAEALQNVNNNIKWLEKNLKEVEQWIQANPVVVQP